MFDVTTLVNPVMSVNPQGMQVLPAQPIQDMLRLDNVVDRKIMVGADSETGLGTVGASMRDAPVLQIKEAVTSEIPDFKHLMLNKASEMDKSYHNMLTQFSNMPTLNDVLADVRKAGATDQMRTYPEAIGGSNVDHAVAQIKQAAMDTVQAIQASSSYNRMITQWGINSQLWMSKMNIITTAVSQISQGFKTLFRISG